MAILLTGGCGYIGSHTAVELISSGYDVVIADNFCNSSPEVKNRIRLITGRDVTVYDADMCVMNAAEKIFEENDISCVIHFAGLKSVPESVSAPLRYYRNNIDSLLTVLETMDKFGCKSIVFSSSASVYGSQGQPPYDEQCPAVCAASPYGQTKIIAEKIITDYVKVRDAGAVLLRYFNPVGAHPSGLMGENPKGTPNNLMPYLVQTAAGKREYLNIYGNDFPTCDGTGVRDYIHVCDLASGHVKAVEYVSGCRGIEIFNLGTGKGTSVLELVDAFERANGVKVPRKFAPRRPGDVAVCYAAVDKAQRVLKWKAGYSIAEMCRDSWRWQTMNPEGYGWE